ncbi:hypothetical protein AGMMS49574_19920 [Bacteroidia bacterium]|nr:hypothetical protein AGMMS49574_19920 [Bacteroidia bacterium]
MTYLLHPRFGAYAATLEDAALNKRIADLLTTGKTSVVKGFISKSGKTFDAALKSDEGYQIVFDFFGKESRKRKKVITLPLKSTVVMVQYCFTDFQTVN